MCHVIATLTAQDLAELLHIRHQRQLSKHVIVGEAISRVKDMQAERTAAARAVQDLVSDRDDVLAELNRYRQQANLAPRTCTTDDALLKLSEPLKSTRSVSEDDDASSFSSLHILPPSATVPDIPSSAFPMLDSPASGLGMFATPSPSIGVGIDYGCADPWIADTGLTGLQYPVDLGFGTRQQPVQGFQAPTFAGPRHSMDQAAFMHMTNWT